MPTYTQANRPISIATPLGGDVLLLRGFSGREAISTLFFYRVELMSENDDVDASQLLGNAVTITVQLAEGKRYINGIVRRLVKLGRREELTFYEAEVVPKVWLHGVRRDCRIFQQKSVVDIAEAVLTEMETSFQCQGTHPARDYTVQYNESNLDFVSRLFEEEGIFYFFEHRDGGHKMVISDANTNFSACPGAATVHMAAQDSGLEDVVTALRSEHSLYIQKVSLDDYNFLQPSLSLDTSVSGKGTVGEVYAYPGKYDARDGGERLARIRLEAEEALRQVVHGESNCRALQSGYEITLKGHHRSAENMDYVLTEVDHFADAGDYRSWDTVELEYRNTFTCIPSSVPYRPPQRTPRPIVPGTQTAVVVGPQGEEIYTDEHARVKVQFYWDREGKNDDKSSCWLRVASTWAGKGWGAIQIPRIGQEVIVDFLEGDPDRPIITGRVYNAEQTPPYKLTDGKTISGVKTRSSQKGSTDNFNEIRLEDKKGSELFYIQAEKDRTILVKNDETVTIKGKRTEEVHKDETITIKGARTEEVHKDEKITIKGGRTEEVTKDEKVTIKGGRTNEITKNDKLSIKQNLDVDVTSNITMKSTGGKISMQAPISIEFKVGGNSIKIDQSGISMKGIMVKVAGSAMAEIKAPMVTAKADAMLELQGQAMTDVKSSGMLMAKGSITMIG